MTISCTCPNCGRVCGFKDIYSGRKARCLACSTRFIIPAQDGGKAHAIPVEPEKPLPGFFHAVFVGSWAVFIQKESLFGLILCIALTCFHFFAGNEDFSFTLGRFRPPLAVGWIITFCCAGYLLWYCMEIINTTMMENDFLPEIFIGGGFAFIGEAAKSIYLFIAAFGIAAIPGAAVTALLETLGVSFRTLNTAIVLLSLLMFPMALCMMGAGVAPWKLFRYDLIIRIITKSPSAYLLTAVVTFAALAGLYLTVGLFSQNCTSAFIVLVLLSARLAAVFILLFAMRTTGLFARHYFQCFPELVIP